MKPQLDFETQLQTVPVRNQHVKTYPAEFDRGVLIAEIELKYRGILRLLAGFTKARKRRQFELAGLSREIYERLDGQRTVEDLVLELAQEEKLSFLEARSLITHYLRDLMQRGLIAVLANESAGSEG